MVIGLNHFPQGVSLRHSMRNVRRSYAASLHQQGFFTVATTSKINVSSSVQFHTHRILKCSFFSNKFSKHAITPNLVILAPCHFRFCPGAWQRLTKLSRHAVVHVLATRQTSTTNCVSMTQIIPHIQLTGGSAPGKPIFMES